MDKQPNTPLCRINLASKKNGGCPWQGIYTVIILRILIANMNVRTAKDVSLWARFYRIT